MKNFAIHSVGFGVAGLVNITGCKVKSWKLMYSVKSKESRALNKAVNSSYACILAVPVE